MSECLHPRKVYSGERFCSNPPIWVWICAECGHMDKHRMPFNVEPECDILEFTRIEERFTGQPSYFRSILLRKGLIKKLNQKI